MKKRDKERWQKNKAAKEAATLAKENAIRVSEADSIYLYFS